MKAFLILLTAAAGLLGCLPAVGAERTPEKTPDKAAEKAVLAKQLWPKARIEAALAAIDKQRDDGLLSDPSYQRRRAMLQARLAGTYVSESLSVTNPPLNFIQNGGFEKVNRNSAANRSRWLWWGGWSWGGDYENRWEDRPEYVHSGKLSARIRCTGKPGRIGIMTPGLPAVSGASGYELTFWARGEGANRLFVNFESGARGTMREQIPPKWTRYKLVGKPTKGAATYNVYFYAIGEGTLWLDDVKLVPVGGSVED